MLTAGEPAALGRGVAPPGDIGDALWADTLGVNFAGGNLATVPGSEGFGFPASGQRDFATDHHDAGIPVMRVIGVHCPRLQPAIEDLVTLASQIGFEFPLGHHKALPQKG
jgi:hypothetical protein